MWKIQSLRAEQSRAEQSRAEQSRAEQLNGCIRLGNLNGKSGASFAGQVYSQDGQAPTLTDMQGGGRQPHIVEVEKYLLDYSMSGFENDMPRIYEEKSPTITSRIYKEPYQILDMRKVEKMELSKCVGGFGEMKSNNGSQYYQQNRVYDMRDVALSHPANLPYGSYNYIEKKKIKIRQATKQGFIECEVPGVCDLNYADSTTRRGRVIEGGASISDIDNGEYP